MSKEKREIHPLYSLKDVWETHEHQVWLASVINIHRNISKFSFPAKLDKQKQDQCLALLFESLRQCPQLEDPILYRSGELDFLEKEFLLEHFLAYDGFHQAHGGEGFIVDKTSKTCLVLNVEDHLQLMFVDTKQEVEKSWNHLAKIEGFLGKRLDYAFNSRFGFLTANPRFAGTGLVVTLFLHIPAIIHSGELTELLDQEQEDEVIACGLQGHSNEMIGDILVARNRCTLGLNEEYLLTTMRMWATKAVVAEVNLRKKLLENSNETLKNKVARSFGLLTHSYQLEAIEALNALSLVKLGADLGWVKVADPINLTQVLFNCRRAHLMHLLDSPVAIPQLPKKRAEYLHGIASKLSLMI
ncbi:MAG: protein arginine kinase [Verrucomicrobia bacterium]|nr:protein arginine kinase [Verrucomicrobiota bacterium]MBS0645650.1 protein arginine kinase [Verrucomicrobiota bacterium]